MQQVFISDTAGVKPTLSQITTKQVGINTADGKMYVNNGTAIKQIGGNLWVPSGNTQGTAFHIQDNTGGTGWHTVVDLVGPVLIGGASITVLPIPSIKTGEIRMTVNGVLFPAVSLTGNSNSINRFVDLVGRYGGIGATTDIDGEPVYCEDSFKLEVRQTVNGTTSGVSIAGLAQYSYGEMV